MPKITFSKEDVMQRNQLQPKWYKVVLREVTEELSSKGDSTNWVCKFVVTDGDQSGTPVRHWFNEKAMGRVLDFVQCFLNTQVSTDKEYEISEIIDRPVLAYIHFDAERKFNVIDDFKKVS